MPASKLGPAILGLALSALLGAWVGWYAGLFAAYWVLWCAVVAHAVGLRNFLFLDVADAAAGRPEPSWRWLRAMLAAVVLSALIGLALLQLPDARWALVVLLALNTAYTAWAIAAASDRRTRAD